MGQGRTVGAATLLVGTATVMVAEFALPLVALLVYDRVIPYESAYTLTMLIGAGLVFVLFEAILRYCREILLARRAMERRRGVMDAATDALFSECPSTLARTTTAEKMTRLWRLRSGANFGGEEDVIVATKAVFLLAYLGLIAVIAGWLALAPLTAVALTFIVSEYGEARLLPRLRKRRQIDDERFGFLLDTLNNIASLKLHGAERRILATYADYKHRSAAESRRIGLASTMIFDIAGAIALAGGLCTLIIGAILTLNNMMTIGALISTLILSSRISAPVQRILMHRARQREARDQPTVRIDPTRDAARAPACAVGPNIGFCSVEAACLPAEDGAPALKDLSFAIEPGEAVLLDVASERESERILQLLIGARRPETGCVRVNGVDIAEVAIEDLAGQVAFLQQKPVIYRGSILDNLTGFGRHAVEDALYVAELLGLSDAVARLPAGFDTELTGGVGDPIPEGLRQQITIVRRLAARPRLILYDHAAATLDPKETEALVNLFQRLHGMATLVLATRDAAMTSLATRRLRLGAAEPPLLEGAA